MEKTQWDGLKNFQASEFACQGPHQGTCNCGGIEDMQPDFMARLQSLRNQYGQPMTITSGYRCPDHNAAVSSTGRDGPHTKGRSVDIAVARGDAWRVLQLAMAMGFKGIGVKQKGNGRFLHIEDRDEPALWSY